MKRAERIAIGVALIAIASIVVMFAMRPTMLDPLAAVVGSWVSSGAQGQQAAKESEPSEAFEALGDSVPTDDEAAAERAEWLRQHQTPLIATVDGVHVRCPIEPANLTGILFHQASFSYALVLSTELPEADYEKTAAERQIRVNREQSEGEWLDADALHVWRVGDTTAMDTSIDVGALAGTVVRSPVTGTVVLVKSYKLYDEVPDIEIHIQPDGRPDLDCVLIHTEDPLVKAGDRVEAGLTQISHVRNIEKDLYDVQLMYFTPEGVGGNHTHVQVNDASDKTYRKEKLKGAIEVK